MVVTSSSDFQGATTTGHTDPITESVWPIFFCGLRPCFVNHGDTPHVIDWRDEYRLSQQSF